MKLSNEISRNKEVMLLSKDLSRIKEIENLRPAADGTLVPVGKPRHLPLANLDPIGQMKLGSSKVLVCANGTSLYTYPTTTQGATAVQCTGSLPAAADCAVGLDDSELMVMTASGAVTVTDNEGRAVVGNAIPEYSGIRLSTISMGPLHTTVPARELAYSYIEDTATRLARNADTLIRDAVGAYRRLYEMATGDGRMIQPAVCAIRLLDSRDNTLYQGAPVLLGLSSVDSSIELYSPDRQTINAYTPEVRTWRIGLHIRADDALAGKVARLEVVCLPQIHPYAPTASGQVTLTNNTSASLPFARLTLPGNLNGTPSGTSTADLIARVAARIWEAGEVVYSVANPFASDADITVSCQGRNTADEDATRIAKMLATASPRPTLPADIRPPHTFAARRVARSGGTILWGDIAPIAFRGYPVESLATQTAADSSAWTVQTRIEFADGRAAYSQRAGAGNRPTALNPFLSYPHPDAKQMRIRISWNSGSWSADFPLKADPGGTFAYYLEPNHAPVAVTANGGAPITHIGGSRKHYPSMLVATQTGTPLIPMWAIMMDDGEITAIAERSGNDTAWDYMRTRFFIGTRGGVHAIGLNTKTGAHSVRRISAQGVSSPQALTALDSGAAALLNTPGGALPVLIGKDGSVAPLSSPMDAYAILYNAVRGEILACGAHRTRVFLRDRGWKWYHRTDLDVRAARMIAGTPYAISDSGVDVLSDETASQGTVPVRIKEFCLAPGCRKARVKSLRLEATGVSVDAEITIARAEPDGLEKEPVAVLKLNGALIRGPRFALYSRPLRACSWCFSGEVDAGFIFKTLTIDYHGSDHS